MCDMAFPQRGGWFHRFYLASQQWPATPPWFRNWVEEHERCAVNLRIWQPSSLSGLLQTEAFALALLRTFPGATATQIDERVAARMARKTILTRDDPAPPIALVDEAALRRCTGSASIMAEQVDHLLAVAGLPNYYDSGSTQYRPCRGNRRLRDRRKGEEIGGVYRDCAGRPGFRRRPSRANLVVTIDVLRTEALRGTESLRLIEEVAREWRRQATGGVQLLRRGRRRVRRGRHRSRHRDGARHQEP